MKTYHYCVLKSNPHRTSIHSSADLHEYGEIEGEDYKEAKMNLYKKYIFERGETYHTILSFNELT